jgi:hypothetical protein
MWIVIFLHICAVHRRTDFFFTTRNLRFVFSVVDPDLGFPPGNKHTGNLESFELEIYPLKPSAGRADSKHFSEGLAGLCDCGTSV